MPGTLDEWNEQYQWSIGQLVPLRNYGLSAGGYPQTSGVETEINGLLTDDRIPKVDGALLKSINQGVIQGREASMLGKRAPRPKPRPVGRAGASAPCGPAIFRLPDLIAWNPAAHRV